MTYKTYPFKRDGKYRIYVRFEDEHGQTRNLSTGVTYPLRHTLKQRRAAFREADQIAKQRVLKTIGLHKPEVRQQIERLQDFLEQTYYPYLKANRAATTLTSYRNALTKFMDLCGNHPLEFYNKSHFNDYKIHRYNNDGIKKTTINIELRAIKAAFGWAYKQDYINKFAFKGQGFLYDVPTTRREFKTYELKTLFEGSAGTMLGLIIQLAYNTGMRIGELSAMKWKMVSHKNRAIHLPSNLTKSGKARIIPLNSKAFNILKIFENELKKKRKQHPKWYERKPYEECHVLIKERGIGRYEARSIQDMFRKQMNKLNLPKELTFHSLRHSFATHALENGADMYGVSKIMGHSTPQVTSEFYDHTSGLHYRAVTEALSQPL
jgi:site-specific recombinase XerD